MGGERYIPTPKDMNAAAAALQKFMSHDQSYKDRMNEAELQVHCFMAGFYRGIAHAREKKGGCRVDELFELYDEERREAKLVEECYRCAECGEFYDDIDQIADQVLMLCWYCVDAKYRDEVGGEG